MRVKILYFASVRERLGANHESIVMEDGRCQVRDVVELLRKRSEVWADVFRPDSDVRFAVDQEFAGPDTWLHDGAELAVFPPITGG